VCAPHDRRHECRRRHVAGNDERERDDRGDGQALKAVGPSAAGTSPRRNDGDGFRVDRLRSRAVSISVAGPAHRGARPVRPGPSSTTVSVNRISSAGRASRLAARRTTLVRAEMRADLGDHRGIVIEGHFSCRTRRSGLQLLDLKQDVGHRRRFPQDEESAFL
jgi:hypothetical protein